VAENAAQLHARPDDHAALVTVRRGFHTLKGSGRMVGLTDLGELAFDVEKILNRLLEEERQVTPAVLAMIAVAQASFRGWVETLKQRGRVNPDANALHAAIAKVEAGLPTLDVTPRTSAIPSVAATPISPAATTLDIEILELDETAQEEGTADKESLHTGVAEVLEFTPASEAQQAPARPVAEAPPEEPEEGTVGDGTPSTALFRILCDEAQQHLATLEGEFQALQLDPAAIPSQGMVRASHTLCGIHRTGGFPLVATTAKALEQCLVGLQERGAPLPGAALPVLA